MDTLVDTGIVDMSHKRLTAESLHHITTLGIDSMRPIEVLKLGFNDIKCEGTSISVEWLRKNKMNPKVLDFSFNDIGDEGAKSLAGSHLIETLEDLHLCGNRIGSAGFKHLGQELSRSTTLRSFNASGNNGKGAGAAYIAEILRQQHTVLRTFVFSGNSVGEKGRRLSPLRCM